MFFCLLGILNYLKNRENRAIIFFSMGTSIKLTPVFFFFWIVFRGNMKTLFKSILAGLFFIILPMFASGFTRGLSDLSWYAEKFVFSNLTNYKFVPAYINQSLRSKIYSIFTDLHEKNREPYTIINLGQESANLIYGMILTIQILVLFYIILCSRGKKITDFCEIPSLIILSMLLLSGITWNAHLLSLSLVYTLWLLKYQNTWTWWTITSCIAASSFFGQSIIGKKMHLMINGYGIYTWIMLLLFICLSLISLKKKPKAVEETP